MHPSKGVSQKDFVRAWQTGTSAIQVAKSLGLTPASASVRATKLRKHGVPLKRYTTFERVDYDELKRIAEELAEPEIET